MKEDKRVLERWEIRFNVSDSLYKLYGEELREKSKRIALKFTRCSPTFPFFPFFEKNKDVKSKLLVAVD